MGLSSSAPASSFGPFWEKKMKATFRRLDYESNGRISKKDFNAVTDYFIQLSKLDANSKRGRQVRRRFIKVWEEFFEKSSANGQIDEIAFVQALKAVGVTKLTEAATRFSDFMFDLLDSNASGTITKEEYAAFGKVFHFEDKTIDETFKIFNRKKDGNITDDEFLAGLREFVVGDNSKSQFSQFIGPLPEQQ